jgi:hypothetical protein
VNSTLERFESAGTHCFGGKRLHTYPDIFCFVFLLIEFKPIICATWTAKVDVCSIAQNPRTRPDSGRRIWAGIPEYFGPAQYWPVNGMAKLHRVAVLAEGFAWNGTTYPSLSKVAFAITGTRWNGPRFFGLRDKPPKGSSV